MTSELAATPRGVVTERRPSSMLANATRALGRRLRSHSADVVAWAGLATLGILLFRFHLTGAATFIGTSDRVNETLAIRKFSVDGIHQLGRVPAWNDSMFLGFAMDAGGYLPGINDPLAYALALFPAEHLFAVYGYFTIAAFILTTWAAYLYIKDACGQAFPAFV